VANQPAVSAGSDGARVSIPPRSPAAQPLSRAVINAAVESMLQNVVETADDVCAATAEKQQALLDNIAAIARSAQLISLKGRDSAGLWPQDGAA
jgi:hypothetical protein